jgi:hypothetical protein
VVRNGVVDGSTVVELLDAEVREEVRRSGVDPLGDADAVRRFARSAVAGHDQRSLSGVVRPVDDPDEVVEELVARVAGFGPLQKYLDDPRVPLGIRLEPLSRCRAPDVKCDPVPDEDQLRDRVCSEADLRRVTHRARARL